MQPRKLLARLTAGSLQNVRFVDMVSLVEAFGFELNRVSGGHHIFTHSRIPGLLNLQSSGGEAKPYQIKQFLRIIEGYKLDLEDRP
jgi:predicted RNA binding protein YcfA (HicA-like mRNA interferase family)